MCGVPLHEAPLHRCGTSRDGSSTISGGSRPRGAARRCTWLALAITSVSSACYSYVPARPEALSGGTLAQVRLTLDGTRDLTGTLGPEVRVVRGVVQRADADSVVLDVRELQLLDGQVTSSTGTTVVIARQQVSEVDRRVSSPGKTAVAVGLAVGAAVVVYIAARPRGRQGEVIGPPGGPQPSVVP